MEKFEYCVFIGRFSPFHKGHLEILKQALKIAETAIVVIGSASAPRSIRNPWSFQERKRMIETSLNYEELVRVKFIDINDYIYNTNRWLSVLQQKISQETNDSEKVALIGFESDETSFYLKLFPQYKYIEHGTKYNFHATNIRDNYFSNKHDYKEMAPDGTVNFLEKFVETDEFKVLQNEKQYIDKYKKSWESAPFPPIFVTVDNIVIKSGHLLLIKRGHNPGKGLFALPGGFLNSGEQLEDAALRELKEETTIKVNVGDLKKAIVESRVFDDPMRSARGRVISHTYLIDLGTGPLPKIKAADDAIGAQWVPLNEFYKLESSFFEDHFHIITAMISKF